MKYINSFKIFESSKEDNIRNIVENIVKSLGEDGITFKTIKDDIKHQLWVYNYSDYSIGMSIKLEYDFEDSFSFKKIFQSKNNYIVLNFLDLNIKNPSDFYNKYDCGYKDGFYIKIDNDIEYLFNEVLLCIEYLKDYIDNN